ncbi:unnamed protein product, partial [Meganyctiphanes norvegica]
CELECFQNIGTCDCQILFLRAQQIFEMGMARGRGRGFGSRGPRGRNGPRGSGRGGGGHFRGRGGGNFRGRRPNHERGGISLENDGIVKRKHYKEFGEAHPADEENADIKRRKVRILK